MKYVFAVLMFLLIAMVGVVAWINITEHSSHKHKDTSLSDLMETMKKNALDTSKLTKDKILEDIKNRFVVVPPGQLWGFTLDQKISVEVLQSRQIDDSNVILASRLNAIAIVTQPTKDSKDPPQSVTVELSGVAKIHYELIANEWYLVDITSVTLRANQK